MKSMISVFVLFGVLFFGGLCLAQETTGNLEGRVVDEAGNPVPYTNIYVTGPSLQGTRTTLTATNGRFRFPVMPVGSYKVKISHISYQELIYEDVGVRLGKTHSLGEIHLTPRLHEAPEVIVTGQRPLIDPTSTDVGANLVKEEFEVLPIERNYRSIPFLLPQSNESFLGDEVNFSGATGLENRYFIDGIDVTDPYRGVTGTNLPYNFVKEVEVKAGGYQAEYRSSLGGILNVISYSGSNEFHGRVFGFYANNRFAGNPRQGALEPASGDFAQYDIGFSLGGPIKRDRLWYYFSYNPTFEAEQVEIPGTGLHDDTYTAHIFGGKLDWKISDKSNLVLTIFGDPSERDAVGIIWGNWGIMPTSFENPDPYLGKISTGGYNLSLYGNYFPNDRFLLEYSISTITRKEKYMPSTAIGETEVMFIDTETGVYSGGYPDRIDDFSMQTTADVKGSYIWDRHTLKAGLQYKDNMLDADEVLRGIYRFTDNYFLDATLNNRGTIHNRIPSVFIQDSWLVIDRLQINAGFRWDGQYLIGSNGEVAQRITDQYQPRLGITYQAGKIGTQKIFGSFGRFYQEFSTHLSLSHHSEESSTIFTEYDHDPRDDPSGGIVVVGNSEIQAEVEGLEGQHYDEFTLGYEFLVARNYKFGATGIYRTLRNGVENGYLEDGSIAYGNPGSGDLSAFPEMKREYSALVLTAQRHGGERFNFIASYVLSKNEGNYTGLYASDFGWAFPNANGSWDWPENLVDGDGLLPNDRTHAFKFSGSYRFDFRLTVGTSFFWQSGTPLNEFEVSSHGFLWYNFAVQRGTSGRTPSIWDLNLRFAYDLVLPARASWHPRLILDVFHLGSQREAVNFDQFINRGVASLPNPTYGLATRYQPPTSVRLGLEFGF